MTSEQLLREAGKYEEKLLKDRRYLHAHPETGFDLSETLAYVRKELTAMGYEPQECGKAGLTVTVGGKKPGKVFLIRLHLTTEKCMPADMICMQQCCLEQPGF